MSNVQDLIIPGCEKLVVASSVQDLEEALQHAADVMGFTSWSATAVKDKPFGPPDFETLTRLPDGFMEFYEDNTKGAVDPVMQHAKRSSVPLVWDQSIYVERGSPTDWEVMAGHGVKNGVITALHMPKGRHFCLAFDGVDHLKSDRPRLAMTIGQVQLVLVHAQAAFARVYDDARQILIEPGAALTPRELECLKWTAAGKTAWEVGEILSISERTANKHLEVAVAKMDCSNKLHAVAKALRDGLIN